MALVPEAVHELMSGTHAFVGLVHGVVGAGGGALSVGFRVGALFVGALFCKPACSWRFILFDHPHRLADLHCAVHDRAGERKVGGADDVRDAPVEPFHLVINELDYILAPFSTLFTRFAFVFHLERFGSDIVPGRIFARRCETRGSGRGRRAATSMCTHIGRLPVVM